MVSMGGAAAMAAAACLEQQASVSPFCSSSSSSSRGIQSSFPNPHQRAGLTFSARCVPPRSATAPLGLRVGMTTLRHKGSLLRTSATGLRSEGRGGLLGNSVSLSPCGASSHFGPSLSSSFTTSECSRLRFSSSSPSSSRDRRSVSRRLVVVQARKNDSVEAPERILGALGYVLPLFDGIQYGRYFFLQFPVAENALRPLYPLLAAYKGFPYSNLIAFFTLYILVVRNEKISRYVRFNAMQAVVLDVLLILPTLIERTFAPTGGIGFELLIIFYNTVFLFLVSCFLFGVVSCIFGKVPRLPIVADAAEAQV